MLTHRHDLSSCVVQLPANDLIPRAIVFKQLITVINFQLLFGSAWSVLDLKLEISNVGTLSAVSFACLNGCDVFMFLDASLEMFSIAYLKSHS